MTDFASAFRRGQLAAEDAARARAEVASVLESLRLQVSEATNGVIEIAVEDDTISMVAALARNFSNRDEPEFATKAIVARNLVAPNQPRATLGRFNMPVEGFPCVITFGRQEERCHDGEALENAFEGMLQDAAVGRALHRLLGEPVGGSPNAERLETRAQADDQMERGS